MPNLTLPNPYERINARAGWHRAGQAVSQGRPMNLIEEFRTFKPGTRERALFYLRTGVLDVTNNLEIQTRLDHWVARIEKFGPRAREKVLRAVEGQSGVAIGRPPQEKAAAP
jgi:hypothetical protein